MPYFRSDDYPSVRRALDVTLDDVTLPDEVIADPLFLGRAEREIARLVPDTSSLTADQVEAIHDALVLLVAANVAPRLPSLLEERGADYDYRRDKVDWVERAAGLRAEALIEIRAVLPPALGAAFAPRTRFTVAHRDRSWAPTGWWPR